MRVVRNIFAVGVCSVSAACFAGAQQASSPSQPASSSAAAQSSITELPDSPGTVLARLDAAQQQGTLPPANASGQAAQTPAQSQATDSQGQRPVGTAASEAPNVSGIAASQPAGVAIAPAKQRRTRTIILRMGAIIGAGAAVGTVIALTAATGSKPPGAH